MLIDVVRLDAVLNDGEALDLIAAETNKWNQEDPHSLTKKCWECDNKGLAFSCLAIDDKEHVSVEHKLVCCNELKASWDWYSQHRGRCPEKDGEPL